MYIIVSERQDVLREFAHGLGSNVVWMNQEAVLSAAVGAPWHLVIVDALTPGLKYKAFLTDLLKVNALLNTAVITDMDAKVFHEDSEGLGVLCAVPPHPGQEDGRQVAERLRALSGL